MSRPLRLELFALLSDVKENPDDLTPWLVLSDWLEENGDEADRARAEYCRLCFDKLGKKVFATDWEQGERRRDLFRTWKEAWLGLLLHLAPTIKKGLVHLGEPRRFLELVPEIVQHEEAWAWVVQLGCPLSVEDLARPDVSRLIGHLLGLDLWTPLKDTSEIETLANFPILARLRRLNVRVNRLTEAGARALIHSPYLIEIDDLHLYTCNRAPTPTTRQRLLAHFGDRLHIW